MFVFYLHDEASVEGFERQLLWFLDRYTLVDYQTVEDVVYGRRRAPRRACHLSVDDGWLSTYSVIFPVMKKHGVPFTVFVSPGTVQHGTPFWYKRLSVLNREDDVKRYLVEQGIFGDAILSQPADLILKELTMAQINSVLDHFDAPILQGSDRAFLNLPELQEMAASGLVEVGAHTVHHPILANETPEDSRSEIADSVSGLSRLVGKPIRTMAYPNGLRGLDFGDREMQAAEQAGLQTAFSVDPGYISSRSSRFALPRIGSASRLKLGRPGAALPSLYDQAGHRKKIRAAKLK